MAKKRTPPSCDCINLCNKALEEKGSNTRIISDQYINLRTGEFSNPRVKITVEKENKRSRSPLNPVFPTYCPFCGKKYTG